MLLTFLLLVELRFYFHVKIAILQCTNTQGIMKIINYFD